MQCVLKWLLLAGAVAVASPPAHSASRARPSAIRSQVPIRKKKVPAKQKQPVPSAKGVKVPVVEKVALDIPELKTLENVGAVAAALERLPGVHSTVIDLKIHLAVVDYNPAQTGLSEFLVACKGAGFEAEEYRVESRFPKPIKLKGG